MIKGWKSFFGEFPEYRNTFLRIQSVDDLVAEWRVLEDTEANRRLFDLT